MQVDVVTYIFSTQFGVKELYFLERGIVSYFLFIYLYFWAPGLTTYTTVSIK